MIQLIRHHFYFRFLVTCWIGGVIRTFRSSSRTFRLIAKPKMNPTVFLSLFSNSFASENEKWIWYGTSCYTCTLAKTLWFIDGKRVTISDTLSQNMLWNEKIMQEFFWVPRLVETYVIQKCVWPLLTIIMETTNFIPSTGRLFFF